MTVSSTSRLQHSLLLLSRDLRSDGRDLRPDTTKPVDEPIAEQLTLPGIDAPVARKPRRRSCPASVRPDAPLADDPLLSVFLQRLAAHGRARKGQKAYEYQMRSM